MRMRRWMGTGLVVSTLAFAACKGDDTHGDVDGSAEPAVPAGAIPAPTEGTNPPAAPAGPSAASDSAAAGAGAQDTTTRR